MSSERPWLPALWRVGDPGNVGTLIRTADAFGAAVQLSDGCADLTGPKAAREHIGSLWRSRSARFAPGGNTRPRACGRRRTPARGASNSEGRSRSARSRSGTGCCSSTSRARLDARIPIEGAESLNVAAAGATALYERRR